MSFTAIVVAAGAGLRAGEGLPKAWRPLGGRAVARWSVESLLAAGAAEVVVVTAAERMDLASEALVGLEAARLAQGGATRTQSVIAGLKALAELDNDEIVLIHDAARPFLARATIAALVEALGAADAALPALPVADTLKRREGEAVATLDRAGLWRGPDAAGVPTGAAAAGDGGLGQLPGSDRRGLHGRGGRRAGRPDGGRPQTLQADLSGGLRDGRTAGAGARITRIGQGVDAHRFGPGDGVDLCGVRIPHSHGLVGHSDADAGLHALTDALLGALGDGDIGEHFPPSDPQWKGAPSHRFVSFAAERIAARGGRIVNVDITLVCEAPKIAPHRPAMRARVAELLTLPLDRVSVKATTTEAMGFTGRREGLLAQAVAAVETPA